MAVEPFVERFDEFRNFNQLWRLLEGNILPRGSFHELGDITQEGGLFGCTLEMLTVPLLLFEEPMDELAPHRV